MTRVDYDAKTQPYCTLGTNYTACFVQFKLNVAGVGGCLAPHGKGGKPPTHSFGSHLAHASDM